MILVTTFIFSNIKTLGFPAMQLGLCLMGRGTKSMGEKKERGIFCHSGLWLWET